MSHRKWHANTQIQFIDDNKIARKQHELSEKHKASIQRAINELHRTNRENERARIEAEKEAGTYKRHSQKKKEQSTFEEETAPTNASKEPIVGEWEEVAPKPVLRQLGSPLSVPNEDLHTIPQHELKLPASQMENKNWNLGEDKKTEDEVLSDEEGTQTKPTVFKKRKVKS